MQKSRLSRRPGAAAEFARAIARAEFGRHYVDDKQLEEVQRSLASKKARRAAPERAGAAERPAPKTQKAKAKEER